LLRLAGLAQVRSCQAAHARLTLPQALPDGLLEVVLPDQVAPVPVLLAGFLFSLKPLPCRGRNSYMVSRWAPLAPPFSAV
jgi:hypothetical protein